MEQILSLNNSLIHNNLHGVKREILFMVDRAGIITDIEPQIIQLLGYYPKNMIGVNFNEFLSIENKDFTFFNNASPTNNIILCLKHKNNNLIYFDINYQYILNSKCETIGVSSSMIETHKYKVNEQRLNIIDNLLDNSKDIIYYFQAFPERKFIYLSKSIEVVLGHSVNFYYENPMYVFETTHPEDKAELEKKVMGKVDFSKPVITRWRHKNGTYLALEDYPIPVYDSNGDYIGVQGVCRDVSERIKLEEELKYLLTHDGFTGLLNRNYFDEEMKKYNDVKDIALGIIICDSDNLKVINDSLGHDKGDLLIKNTAMLLSKLSDENRVISRLGGDEFAILIKNTTKLEVVNISKEIHSLISKHNLENENFKIKLSLGIAFSKTSLNKTNLIFKLADKNMYINKIKRKRLLGQP